MNPKEPHTRADPPRTPSPIRGRGHALLLLLFLLLLLLFLLLLLLILLLLLLLASLKDETGSWGMFEPRRARQPPGSVSEWDVHDGVTCSSCRGPVRGNRYKCLECKDFDLCSSCEASGTKHSQHSFIRLPSRVPVDSLAPELDGATREVHPGVTCCSCGRGVRGKRYRCLACPDSDFCSSCEQAVVQHFLHPMIRFSKPDAIAFGVSVICPDGLHRGVRCGECGGSILGHRYKCLQCQDLDLCPRCEASSKHLHHRMLRIPSKRKQPPDVPRREGPRGGRGRGEGRGSSDPSFREALGLRSENVVGIDSFLEKQSWEMRSLGNGNEKLS
ncbi:unnamed protein product [Darwinula stevensoni]|uniref:ZZ-type domain-containing protein n=1 Tax=Darwinula stevensoni TaxID=69355 RepID=A0A7R9A8V0_9CRUS|nr:unnamed protein product [Darwinula stevensoni]CAG0896751.1 unnamed protein product [Darwinula stevensoni]